MTETFVMKQLIALALFLAVCASAQARPAPFEAQPTAISPDDLTVSTGPAGATLEQDYFRAPQPAYARARVFPCRLQLRIFDKTRLAQSCE
jgi:hypothetical protein